MRCPELRDVFRTWVQVQCLKVFFYRIWEEVTAGSTGFSGASGCSWRCFFSRSSWESTSSIPASCTVPPLHSLQAPRPLPAIRGASFARLPAQCPAWRVFFSIPCKRFRFPSFCLPLPGISSPVLHKRSSPSVFSPGAGPFLFRAVPHLPFNSRYDRPSPEKLTAHPKFF